MAEIVVPEHLIDCDAQPLVPDGWSIEEHRKGGAFKWNAKGVTLHLDSQQKRGKWIDGNNLRKALDGKPVLNANVLDHLFVHPHLIPEEWKGKAVFFWGTIYRHRSGRLYVRYLEWDRGRWRWFGRWLDSLWNDLSPAVSAS